MFGLFTISFFALKTIHIPWMNPHKISFVDFQWGGMDESSSINLGFLLEGTSLGYVHPRDY